MNAPLQHRHELPPFNRRVGEAASSADPINALLDLFEAQVNVLIENGAEFQLRTRIERLLPREEPEADLFVPPAPPRVEAETSTRPVAPEQPASFDNIEDALGYANAISVVTHRARGVRAGPSRDQAEAALRFLLAKLATLRGQS
jgi:hypothetical protein